MAHPKLVFVDIETSGSSISQDSIIEIGIVVVQEMEIIDTFSTFISFEGVLPSFITRLTGITKQMLHGAPSFEAIVPRLVPIFENAIFVAHNVSFDYAFIKHALHPFQARFAIPNFDTVKLSRKFFPEYKHHNLQAIIDRFQFQPDERHRAFADAKVLADFYFSLCDQFSQATTWTIIDSIMTKPHEISHDNQKPFPTSPGVYTFLDRKQTILYIGKSKNLKRRITSHFAAMHQNKNELALCSQTETITIHETAGELGALLYESEQIKLQKPIYNKQLRKKESVIVIDETSCNSYLHVHVQAETLQTLGRRKVIAICKSKTQAKQLLEKAQEQFSLCPQPGSMKACFHYHIGACFGACLKKESPLSYNLRFEKAFESNRILPWMFPEGIQICEHSNTATDLHYFYHWMYYGTEHTIGNIRTVTRIESPYFDYDLYLIVRLFLKRHPNTCNEISLISIEMLLRNEEASEYV